MHANRDELHARRDEQGGAERDDREPRQLGERDRRAIAKRDVLVEHEAGAGADRRRDERGERDGNAAVDEQRQRTDVDGGRADACQPTRDPLHDAMQDSRRAGV